MKIKRIEYEIEPINDFFRIVIFEEENKFTIGLSFIGNYGTDSFLIFKIFIFHLQITVHASTIIEITK